MSITPQVRFCVVRPLPFMRGETCIFAAWLFFGSLYAENQPVPAPDKSAAATPANATEGKYKRRVLLTVFINEYEDEERAYLSESIPAAFSAPLTKTGNFVVLNRVSVQRYLQTMGIELSDVYEDENAVRLGRAIGADVVVVGKFESLGNNVEIHAKAIDVQAGRLSVEDSVEIETNALMFNAINQLAKRMSVPMAEKLKPTETPPPPAEVVLTEEQIGLEVKKIEEKKHEASALREKVSARPAFDVVLHAGASGAIGLGYTRGVYPLGLGAFLSADIAGLTRLFFERDWLHQIAAGLMGGFQLYSTKNSSYENLTQIPVHGFLGYRLQIPWVRDLTAMPLVSAGMHFGRFSNINGTAAYRLFGFSAGARAEYTIGERWLLGYAILLLFESDQGLNYALVNVLSVGVRW